MENNLTVKQEKFIANYLESGNGTQSAIDAGYSEKTSYSIANELLKNPDIAKAIEEKRKEMWCKFAIHADEALQVQVEIMRSPDSSFKNKLDATNSILDRAGFRPIERQEVTGINGQAIQFESKITSELAQRARQLLAEKNG